jgi:hypothetical protein
MARWGNSLAAFKVMAKRRLSEAAARNDLDGLGGLSHRRAATSMLLPRFTIRWILGFTLVCALALLIVRASINGSAWATGVSVAMGFVIITLLIHGLFFWLMWMASLIFTPRQHTPGHQAAGGTRSNEAMP